MGGDTSTHCRTHKVSHPFYQTTTHDRATMILVFSREKKNTKFDPLCKSYLSSYLEVMGRSHQDERLIARVFSCLQGNNEDVKVGSTGNLFLESL